MTDYYATLGVARNASQDEIKKAFRRLASQHHPDKGGDTAKFQEIQAAYDTLGDEQKRAAYDNPAPQFTGFHGNPGGPQFNDIFSQMFGGASPFGFGQHPRRNHVRMTIWINILDVAQGGSRTVNVSTTAGTSTVEIEIPKGIEDGDNVQYPNSAPGGMDLVVQYRVHPDRHWQRNGLNLQCEKSVSIWDMILGNDIEIDTLQNTKLITTILPKTQPGTVLRLRNQGLLNNQGQRGDLLIKLHAQIPQTVAPEILDAIQKHR